MSDRDEWSAFHTMFKTPDYEPGSEADNFAKTCEDIEGVDYGWYWAFALRRFDDCQALHRELDGKAEALIRYVGLVAGFFTAAALFQVNRANLPVALAFFPSFLAAILSIIYASAAREPRDVLNLPSIRQAFDYANYFRTANAATARFAATVHRAVLS